MILDHTASSRENNFNLLRLIAAAGVLVSHAWVISLGAGTPEPLQDVLQGMTLGTVCVFVFFAISGYFIAQSYDRSKSLSVFMVARILRIFPALIIVLILTIIVAAIFFTNAPSSLFVSDSFWYFVRNATLFFLKYDLVGVFEENPYGQAINGSLWTLNYEFICYCGVAILGVIGLHANRAVTVVILLTCGIIFLIAQDQTVLHHRINLLITLSFPFIFGMALYAWRHKIPMRFYISIILAIFSILFYNTLLFELLFIVWLSYTVFLIGCFQNRILLSYNRFGDYSYGVYIYAFPIQQIVAYHGVTSPVLNIMIAFPLTLLCGILSWRMVERPALRLKSLWRVRSDTVVGGARS
jgi:peptidoglycan/LPS O-acetylase OafA/YrhL